VNRQQVSEFVHRFLDASQCRIIEKTPARTTVKLSPEADKALMGRSYYWDFVERTGAPAETMTLTLVFDPDAEPPEETRSAGPTAVRTLYVPGRPPREVITYGCRRLEQMFQTVRRQGMYVMLYEQPEEPDPAPPRRKTSSRPYTTWLAVNFKVEYACDMKREDIHSLGISLSSGEIADRFHSILERKNLTPRLPQHVHLRRGKPRCGSNGSWNGACARRTIAGRRMRRRVSPKNWRAWTDIMRAWRRASPTRRSGRPPSPSTKRAGRKSCGSTSRAFKFPSSIAACFTFGTTRFRGNDADSGKLSKKRSGRRTTTVTRSNTLFTDGRIQWHPPGLVPMPHAAGTTRRDEDKWGEAKSFPML